MKKTDWLKTKAIPELGKIAQPTYLERCVRLFGRPYEKGRLQLEIADFGSLDDCECNRCDPYQMPDLTDG